MGTDMHVSIESKLPTHDNRWVPIIVDEGIPRDYWLFNFINAKVRPGRREGSENSIVPGEMAVPYDITKAVKAAYDESYGHNFTVLTMEQIRQHFPWTWATLTDLHFRYFATLVYAYVLQWEFYEYRVILWFDN